jgi:SAM-dependent methyltransferase
VKDIVDAQHQHWQKMFDEKPEMFGAEPSDAARIAVEMFKKEGSRRILELGAGQGRDTLFFAQNGFLVHALDYAQSAVETIAVKARKFGLSGAITATQHDVRDRVPFDDEMFDGCYSHMLFCMALTTQNLEFLSDEVRRVLKPAGLNIYTVRNNHDPDYGTGIHRGEDMYEVGGFVVHFFSREKVMHLAKGYDVVSIDEFEEGRLPRKLFRVTLRKKSGSV